MLAQHQSMKIALLAQQANLPIHCVRDGQCHLFMTTSGTVLHTAVSAGQLDSVKLLLPHQSDPDVLDLWGKPASHIAAQHGRDDILELLLSHGSELDARDFNMMTLLGSAVVSGHMDAIRLLLDHGADLSARDYRGQSLFELAKWSRKPAVFFALMEAGLSPALEDIYSWYHEGCRQVLMAGDHMQRLAVMPRFLLTLDDVPETKAILSLVPAHYRKLNLTCRGMNVHCTVLYRASTMGRLDLAILLHNAGAMLNLEGGAEGTPLMGACRTGRLEVVKYLVRNGAIPSYVKNGIHISAFNKATSYPKIQRWLLVERFIDQRMIVDGEAPDKQAPDVTVDYTWTDEIADVSLDLVLEDDVEWYLESKNWFLSMRRFVDNGQRAFVRVPILPEEFARYRPLCFKVSGN
jgi:ankyrin repeat protein